MRHITVGIVMLLLIVGCGGETDSITGVFPQSDIQSIPVTAAGAPAVAAGASESRVFVAHLDGQDSGVDTRSQGQAVFRLSRDGSELHFRVVVARIRDVVGAHIHLAAPGENGPIVLPLLGDPFIPDPGVSKNGVLVEGVATAADVGGPLAGDLPALLGAMADGNTYVNVHTVEHRSGQIRGQIR